jgi:hypothetical protein
MEVKVINDRWRSKKITPIKPRNKHYTKKSQMIYFGVRRYIQ